MGAWPAFTNQQVADAEARACAAYTTVRTGVSLQTHATGAADPDRNVPFLLLAGTKQVLNY